MHRNLDRRVEALVRITDATQIQQLIDYIDLQMSENTNSWHMQPDGDYVRHSADSNGNALTDSQSLLIARHSRSPRASH